MPFAARWVDLEIITLGEESQTVKDKHCVIFMFGILKKDTNEFICRTEMDSQTLKTNLKLPNGTGGWGGRDGQGVWNWHMHTEVYGMIGHWGPAV